MIAGNSSLPALYLGARDLGTCFHDLAGDHTGVDQRLAASLEMAQTAAWWRKKTS